MADFSKKQILSFHIKLDSSVESNLFLIIYLYTHIKIHWCTISCAEVGSDLKVENIYIHR